MQGRLIPKESKDASALSSKLRCPVLVALVFYSIPASCFLFSSFLFFFFSFSLFLFYVEFWVSLCLCCSLVFILSLFFFNLSDVLFGSVSPTVCVLMNLFGCQGRTEVPSTPKCSPFFPSAWAVIELCLHGAAVELRKPCCASFSCKLHCWKDDMSCSLWSNKKCLSPQVSPLKGNVDVSVDSQCWQLR